MVNPLIYRSDDVTRWGTGQDSDLDAPQIDVNFYTLWFALNALEGSQESLASIVSANIQGNQLFFHLSNDAVLGPLTVPSAQWNAKGDWQPNTAYAAFDVFTNNGKVYLAAQASPGAATFSPTSSGTNGQPNFMLLLENPDDELPPGGVVGQMLLKATGSPLNTEWANVYARIVCQIIGQPDPGEVVLQYVSVDDMTLPNGLTKSIAYNSTFPSVDGVVWTINQNGNVLGTIIFNADGSAVNEFTSDAVFVPGDVLTIVAPSAPDTSQANITIVLAAIING